ncbi:MAG: RNA pseudouridine synthase, partial [Myxococcota bacterium]
MLVRYEDGAIVVIDKPFGLPTQAPRGGGANLFDQVRDRWPRAALLHRLDTVASGLVLFAVDPVEEVRPAAAWSLSRQAEG